MPNPDLMLRNRLFEKDANDAINFGEIFLRLRRIEAVLYTLVPELMEMEPCETLAKIEIETGKQF